MNEESDSLPELDIRYLAARHGDMAYRFPSYETLAAWETRAAWLRRHLLCVQGLWPMPERAPLKAQISGRLTYDDYTIEGVQFESWPGFYCTGNLYRPRRAKGPCPAILNPHGHWSRGRLEHQPLGSIRARCITFARLGMVALAYDMVGYNDSVQVPHRNGEPQHRFATLRGALWGLSPMALQTWNSIRAIDFLQSLEDVDPERIGCTGASGGGTQTFMVTAIDERIRVAAPVNMISAHFQGGCVCENTPGLRTQTYNVEIGALTAPRPLLMVSATGDWTVNTPQIEYPAIRSIYRLFGAEERLAWAQVDEVHNYNAQSRDHVYRWFARWFLGQELDEAAEKAFVVEPDERMRIYPTAVPESADVERAFRQRAEERLRALMPGTPEQLERLREITCARLEHVLEASVPQADDVLVETADWVNGPGWRSREVILGRRGLGDRVPATLYAPPDGEVRDTWLMVHHAGREGLQDSYGDPGALIVALLERGCTVLALEPFDTGAIHRAQRAGREASAPEVAQVQPRHDGDWFWLTFNPALLGQRVQDVLTGLIYLRATSTGEVGLIGLRGAGPWAMLAAALCDVPTRICADLPADEDDPYLGELFVPALRAYGDLRVSAALLAPRWAMIASAGGLFPRDWIEAAYASLQGRARLRTMGENLKPERVMMWLDGIEQADRT
ncbi:MAG: acetylxylan esterase [Anaerolineae bacterium]|nr:acetylxylan esterase [Anaerolineae bacterium]